MEPSRSEHKYVQTCVNKYEQTCVPCDPCDPCDPCCSACGVLRAQLLKQSVTGVCEFLLDDNFRLACPTRPTPLFEPWLSSCRAVEAPSRRCRACCRGLACRALSSLSRLTPCAGASSFVEVCRGLSSSCRAVELSSNVELMNSCLAVEPGNAYAYSFA